VTAPGYTTKVRHFERIVLCGPNTVRSIMVEKLKAQGYKLLFWAPDRRRETYVKVIGEREVKE